MPVHKSISSYGNDVTIANPCAILSMVLLSIMSLVYVLLKYFVTGVCSIRGAPVCKSMGFHVSEQNLLTVEPVYNRHFSIKIFTCNTGVFLFKMYWVGPFGDLSGFRNPGSPLREVPLYNTFVVRCVCVCSVVIYSN